MIVQPSKCKLRKYVSLFSYLHHTKHPNNLCTNVLNHANICNKLCYYNKNLQSVFYHLEWYLYFIVLKYKSELHLLDCKISFYGCQFRSIDYGCLFMILIIWALGTGWPKKFWTVVFNDLNGLKLPQWPQRPKMTSMAFNDLKCPKLPQMTSMAFGDLNGLK